MVEVALHKGHRYATVAICADTRQVLWIGEGRSLEAVAKFGREVTDRVRVDQANQLRQGGQPAGRQAQPLAAATQPRQSLR
jgi:transposase